MKNIIESVRKEQSISQETLANAIGVSRQTIISIEHGKCVPSVAIALRISRFLGTTVEELFTGEAENSWCISPAENENYISNRSIEFDNDLIYGQKSCCDFLYGHFPLSFNGGEIIAVYNAMFLYGVQVSLAELILEFEENRLAMLGGFAGTDPKKIGLYFSAHGIPFHAVTSERELKKRVDSAERAVLVYSYIDVKCPLEKRGLHTVAAIKDNGVLRVFNMNGNDSEATEFPSLESVTKGKLMLASYILD